MSCAVSTLANATSSRRRDPANDARSTFDKMISRYRLPSAASASRESGNAGQSGTDPPSRAASSSVTSAPRWSPSRRMLAASTAGYSSAGCSASTAASHPEYSASSSSPVRLSPRARAHGTSTADSPASQSISVP
jgi:hypothetical protein